jgi:hypothetical protein
MVCIPPSALPQLFNRLDELRKLLALSSAQIEKPDPHVERIMDSLGDSAKPKWQAIRAELDLHPAEDSNRKASFRVDAATTKAHFDDVPMYKRGDVDQANDGPCIDHVSRLDAPVLLGG